MSTETTPQIKKQFGDSVLLGMAIAADNTKRAIKSTAASAVRGTKNGVASMARSAKNAVTGAATSAFNSVKGGAKATGSFAMRSMPALTVGVTAGAATGTMFMIAMVATAPFVAAASIGLGVKVGLGLLAGGSALGVAGQSILTLRDMDKRSKILLAEHRRKQAAKAVQKANEAEADVKTDTPASKPSTPPPPQG